MYKRARAHTHTHTHTYTQAYTVIGIKEVVNFFPVEELDDVDNGVDVGWADTQVKVVAVPSKVSVAGESDVGHVERVTVRLDDVKRLGGTGAQQQEDPILQLIAHCTQKTMTILSMMTSEAAGDDNAADDKDKEGDIFWLIFQSRKFSIRSLSTRKPAAAEWRYASWSNL